MVFSKYVLGGNYMIPVCRDDISTSLARIDFTVQLHEEIKFHLGSFLPDICFDLYTFSLQTFVKIFINFFFSQIDVTCVVKLQ